MNKRSSKNKPVNKKQPNNIDNANFFFSAQENLIAEKLVRNPSYKEVARETKISLKMVAYYISSMMRKTNVSSKEELVSVIRRMKKKNADISFSEKTADTFTKYNFHQSTYIIAIILLLVVLLVSGICIFKKYFFENNFENNNFTVKPLRIS